MKGWLAAILCLSLGMGLVGCSGWAESQRIDRLQSQVEELQVEMEGLRGELDEDTPDPLWTEWMPWQIAWRMLLRKGPQEAPADVQYWCMGKGDSCPNPTSGPFDLYCDQCDPDGDNREG